MLALGLSASRKFRQVRSLANFDSDRFHLDFSKIIISNLSATELCRSGGWRNPKWISRLFVALCLRRCQHRSVYPTLQAFSFPDLMTVGDVLNPDCAGPKWKRSRGKELRAVNCQTFSRLERLGVPIRSVVVERVGF